MRSGPCHRQRGLACHGQADTRVPITPEQRRLYERNREQISHGFTAFKTTREDGALLGPWGVFLHEPAVGQAHYDQIGAITAMQQLALAAKQVAIIVVGARFKAA